MGPRSVSTMKWWVVFSLLIVSARCAVDVKDGSDPLDALIEEVEYVVQTVASAATKMYSSRLQSLGRCNCTLLACGSQFSRALKCSDRLGGTDACDCEGHRKLDYNNSYVRVAKGTDPNSLSDEQKESICTFAPLDEVFIDLFKKTSQETFSWTYIGTPDGTMRSFPGMPRQRGLAPENSERQLGNCQRYDPRWRPWYIQAVSGPKDVVLVLDISGSMLEPSGQDPKFTRWHVLKEATLRLLDTYGISDFIGVVTFSGTAQALQPKLLRADKANIELLKQNVEDIVLGGKTDFRTGFEAAFDLLISASKDFVEREIRVTSNCEKVIVFLTDGLDCTVDSPKECTHASEDKSKPGASPADLVLKFIDDHQDDLVEAGSTRATIFTSSTGHDADEKIPKMIACANGGAWSSITESDDPLIKMAAYVRFLARGRGQAFADRRGVIWSNFYEDVSGLGQMTTATMPVYSPKVSKDEEGVLVGVVAHDVTVASLKDVNPDFKDIVNRLIGASERCVKWDLSGCQLQLLRGPESECPESFKPKDCYFLDSTEHYYTSPRDTYMTFEKAQSFCAELGGSLATLDRKEEIQFVSGLASPGGSWIGLKRGTDEWDWVEASNDNDLMKNKDFWAPENVLITRTASCGAIDRRGVRNNVFGKECEDKARFICEFSKPPEQCKKGVLKVNNKYKHKVPPISDCQSLEESITTTTKPPPVVKGMQSNEVLCKLGPQKSTEEVLCCGSAECT